MKQQQLRWLRATVTDWARWFLLAFMVAVILLTFMQLWEGTGW